MLYVQESRPNDTTIINKINLWRIKIENQTSYDIKTDSDFQLLFLTTDFRLMKLKC